MRRPEETVTAVIPMFNAESTILRALDSLLNQSYPPIEILIIDDGSTDGSILKVSLVKDKRIRLVSLKENMGVAFARNVAIDEARGSLLAWMDADDWSFPKRFAWQVPIFKKNPGLILGTGWTESYSELPRHRQGVDSGSEWVKTSGRPMLRSRNLVPALLFGNPIANSCVMMRVRMIREFGIRFNVDLPVSEDYSFVVEASRLGGFNLQRKVLVKRWESSSGLSSRFHEQHLEAGRQIRHKILSEVGVELTDRSSEAFELLSGGQTNIRISPETLIVVAKLIAEIRACNQQTRRFPISHLDEVIFSRLLGVVVKLNNPLGNLPLVLDAWRESGLPIASTTWAASQFFDEIRASLTFHTDS